jgi:protoheme IX farnesyltransferase
MTAFSSSTLPTRASRWIRLRAYWTLVKSLQTGLLVITGLAGYVSARLPLEWGTLLAVAGSLSLAISGSTFINMVCDADIDAHMSRTRRRPLPAGLLDRTAVVWVGTALSALGIGWAMLLAPLYGLIVLAGLFFDVVVYTLWLKRRTPWSILWGGLAGGMPILAGRTLGAGGVDLVGLLLALAVLFWIPTHIVTFSIKNADDYCLAGVPVFPNTHGVRTTRLLVALSTAAAVITMIVAVWQMGLAGTLLQATIAIGLVLLIWTIASLRSSSPRPIFVLYKLASLYMLGSMVVIIVGAVF